MAAPTPWNNTFVVNTTTLDTQNKPHVTALADGRFVMTWTDASENATVGNSTTDVRMRIFNADGTPKTGEIILGSTNGAPVPGSQLESTIAMLPDGRFIAVWAELVGDDGSQKVLKGQVFSVDGASLGTFDIGTAVDIAQVPTITVLGADRFMVGWQEGEGGIGSVRAFTIGGGGAVAAGAIHSVGGNTTGAPVLAASQDGTKSLAVWADDQGVAAEFISATGVGSGLVEVFHGPDTSKATVTRLKNGGYVVTWQQLTGEHEGYAQIVVSAKVYDANLNVVRDTFTVSTGLNEQQEPAVTALIDGRFVITWSNNHDPVGSPFDLSGQVFRADGTKDGDEFTIHNASAQTQDDPTITTLVDGRIVIAWHSDNGDDAGGAIHARILEPREAGINLGGTPLNDHYIGSGYSDTFSGADGHDILIGAGGDDTLDGGSGDDTLDGGGDSDSIVGGAGQDILVGGAGSDTLQGGADSDTLDGGDGADVLDGGDGVDRVSFATVSTGVVITLSGTGPHKAEAAGQKDTLANIEIFDGSQYSDTFIGNAEANVFNGLGGNDELYGSGGDDTLDGGAGDDHLFGGLGSNKLIGGSGFDIAHYEDAALGNLTLGVSSLDGIEGLSLGAGNDTGYGDAGANYLAGWAGADTLYGQGGNDTLYGGTENDYLSGDAGYDALYGGQGDDRLSGGTENDTLYGESGSDTIFGDQGGDVLSGGSENDRLYGGIGKDVLTGGSGKDIFVFEAKPNKRTNLDKITDFNVKDDTIWLDNKYMPKLGKGTPTKPVKLNKAFFTIGDKAKDGNDYLVYNAKKGILYYDVDGSGAKAMVEIATLKKGLKLTYADFFVI